MKKYFWSRKCKRSEKLECSTIWMLEVLWYANGISFSVNPTLFWHTNKGSIKILYWSGPERKNKFFLVIDFSKLIFWLRYLEMYCNILPSVVKFDWIAILTFESALKYDWAIFSNWKLEVFDWFKGLYWTLSSETTTEPFSEHILIGIIYIKSKNSFTRTCFIAKRSIPVNIALNFGTLSMILKSDNFNLYAICWI